VDLRVLLLVAPVLLFSLVAHEYAHGYAALRQGDATAYQLGRLTWNPIKHIDPFMTCSSGHARARRGADLRRREAVPIEPRNFRRYKRGDIIVSLAGRRDELRPRAGVRGAVRVLGLAGAQLPRCRRRWPSSRPWPATA
jgi:Zn-dependent protease